mmetsp:Transcript_142571/g.371394  ORF Transcript_142571/g.371394 Transcript_142571/m.371394 type:complete len:927 (-) Transcript_142571:51-2831(-)
MPVDTSPSGTSSSTPLSPAVGHLHTTHHGSHGRHHVHIHGPFDKNKALTIGSLGFEPVFNQKYNKDRMAHETHGFLLLQRSLPIIIGLLTAAAAVVVGTVSEKLGDLRTTKVINLIINQGWLMAWLAEFGMMTAMVLIGGFCVYAGDKTKSAGSSGIPQLIALLNGCDIRGEFSIKHLCVKWFGVCFAVASGLVAGPEGPMIFIGACIGFWCSELPQSRIVWSVLGPPPKSVPDDVFKRDYTSIGAACGIAAAFRAPIAGTLFIVEEAASHFKKEELSYIFFGGLAALEVILVSGGAGAVLEYKVQIGTNCSETPWWSFFFLVILGSICGVAGAAFNTINIKVMKIRNRMAVRCQQDRFMLLRRRVAELVFLCLISSAAWLLAASMFGEVESTTARLLPQSTGCLKDDWKNQVVAGSVIEKQGDAYVQKFTPLPCLYGMQHNPELCPQVFDLVDSNLYAKTCVDPVLSSDISGRADYKNYCCAFDSITSLQAGSFQMPSNASCPIELGESAPSLSDSDEKTSYSSMGVLALVPFKTACQNLFARGVPHLLSLPQMSVFLVLFFLLGAITAGSAIPSGLLMPQMVMGGLIGRIAAMLVIQLQTSLQLSEARGSESIWAAAYQPLFSKHGGPLPSHSILMPETAGALDPGIGALIGAAAFLGGSGRVTLFTTVMMVEITGDPVMIFPVGFATIFAVLVGNCLNHGLYHSLVDIQSLPYLPDTWQGDQLPPGIKVKAMKPPNKPIVIPVPVGEEDGREAIQAAFNIEFNGKKNDFQCFPLVKKALNHEGVEKSVVIGMSERKYLVELLAEREGRAITEEDLMSVSDLYPITVREDFPLQAAYQLFKSMDMKSLVVVDDYHSPVAVMTRFAFLAWRVAERVGPERLEELWDDERELRTQHSISRRLSRRLSNISISSRRRSSSASNGESA